MKIYQHKHGQKSFDFSKVIKISLAISFVIALIVISKG